MNKSCFFKMAGRAAAAALVATVLAAAACNTVHGAGKDVEKAGEAVQDAAK